MVKNVICRGFGPGASIAFVVTRGYSIGVSTLTPITDACVATSGQYVIVVATTGQYLNSVQTTGRIDRC